MIPPYRRRYRMQTIVLGLRVTKSVAERLSKLVPYGSRSQFVTEAIAEKLDRLERIAS